MLKSLHSEIKDPLQQEDSDSLDSNGSRILANKSSTVTHATMATKLTAQAADIVDPRLTGGESAQCNLGNRTFCVTHQQSASNKPPLISLFSFTQN